MKVWAQHETCEHTVSLTYIVVQNGMKFHPQTSTPCTSIIKLRFSKISTGPTTFSQLGTSALPGEVQNYANARHMPTHASGRCIQQPGACTTVYAPKQFNMLVWCQNTMSWVMQHRLAPLQPVRTCATTKRPFFPNSNIAVTALWLCDHHSHTSATQNVAKDDPIASHRNNNVAS